MSHRQLHRIVKIGLAVRDGGRVLLVKKRGGQRYILPGGKPETGEADLDTLQREIHEELGCAVESGTVEFLGCFTDVAADMTNITVTVRLYSGQLIGRPAPQAEIEILKWVGNREEEDLLSPSLRNQILPFLFSRDMNRVSVQKIES